jgi:hypothetical protein
VRVGPKGTISHPLDGGALSLVGNALAGERTRGGGTAFFSVPPWVASLWSSRFGAREEGKEESKGGRDADGLGPCRRSTSLSPVKASHGPPYRHRKCCWCA